METLHEVTREEVLADPERLWGQVHEGDRDFLERRRREAARTVSPLNLEVRVRLPSGRAGWRSLAAAPRRLPDGRLVWDGIVTDISDRKRSEEASRESQERLRSLSDNLPGGLVFQFESKADGSKVRVVHVSAGVEALHEVTAEDVLTGRVDILSSQVSEEDRLRWTQGHLAAMESMTPLSFEVLFRLPSGKTRWAYVTSAPRRLPDGRVLWDGLELDITDRKRAEEEQSRLREQLNQAQKMESIGRLAGGIAHDFNNMLAVIIGQADLALDLIPESDPMAAELQRIQAAADRSAELTRQLLAFARKQTILPKILDLNRTVAGMLQMLRRLIGENIELIWAPGSDTGLVRMDPSQIDQILVNLCLNARDAISEQGRILIETANADLGDDYRVTYAGYRPGKYVMLAVSDDGSGMDAETVAHAFEPFFTTKGPGKGTGLGLATVYGIVSQNEGFVNVYSEPGHGTIFKIYLPRCTEGWAPTPEAPVVPTEGGHETILLVEDELMLREIIGEMLQRHGYTVVSAATPEDAVRLAREYEGEIHLVLTDVVMPQMSGCELVNEVQPFHPRARRLFMSGYTASLVARHGVMDFDLHYIQKPFSMHDLAYKIRQALAE